MIFYAPDCSIQEEEYVLSEIESKHCIRVLRKQHGSNIELINGKGGHFICEIIDPHVKRCKVKIKEKKQHEVSQENIHIAMAIPKSSERLEWFLEKATEIGIDQITPIICDHSERKVIKMDRMEKIVVSAMKQSLKFHLPVLNPMCSYKEFVSSHIEEEKFIAHCEDRNQNLLKNAIQSDNILILIGPEGDFSSKEIDLAAKYGFTQISLGESRLRTETAAVVAVQNVAFINQ